MGQTGFCENLLFPAGFCENLRFPVVCCETLRLRNAVIPRKSEKYAKISENLRKKKKTTANLAPFVPFSLSLLIPPWSWFPCNHLPPPPKQARKCCFFPFQFKAKCRHQLGPKDQRLQIFFFPRVSWSRSCMDQSGHNSRQSQDWSNVLQLQVVMQKAIIPCVNARGGYKSPCPSGVCKTSF